MSLGLSLNNALTGLRANQQAISVLSHNIANANTPGYSRQIVEQSAIYIDGVGSGVRIDDVIRKVDKYLQRAIQTQGAEVARTGVVNNYFERLNVILGQPGSQNTLDEYVTGFFNSLQTLNSTPDRTSARSGVLAAASALSGNLSGLAQDLNDLRFEADSDMRDTVAQVNETLRKLDSLNVAIGSAHALGQSTAGLLDNRDNALRALSGFLDITTAFAENGTVSVAAGNGLSLVDGIPHELRYSPAQSADQFIQESALNALTVVTLNSDGNVVGVGQPLISGGTSSNVTSTLTGGTLEGLRLMRDSYFPAVLDQLDMLAANLRDAINVVHNDGSGFPPAASLTGTRSVAASQAFDWSGSVRIAVLQKSGAPLPAAYGDETGGFRPLTLRLSELNSGDGDDRPTLQTIVDEINNHFGSLGPKAKLANFNNIRLASDSTGLIVGATNQLFDFDFDLENISSDAADFFITGVTVRDDTAADITNVTQGAPSIALNPAGAYTTTLGSADVTLNLLDTPTVAVGDTIYLGPPAGADVNGILAANITGYFTVTSVSGNTLTITAGAAATSTGTLADASGVSIMEPYETVAAGETTRTRDHGELQVNLGGAPASDFYDITVSVGTVDSNGVVRTSNITYRVTNGQGNLLNDRYDNTSVTGDASRISAQTTQQGMRAILVDENGVELPKLDGQYLNESPSYLKLMSLNADYVIALDEIDSAQLGSPNENPPVAGTNRGFSHYFGLNDFFAPNEQSITGDTVKNSAINLRVAQRLLDDPNLISTGNLVRGPQPAGEGAAPNWSYMRYSGDNGLIARLAAVGTQTLNFDAAGGLPSIGLTLSGYTSELLGFTASSSAAASDQADTAQVLFDGFKTRSDAISGVNLDEELANTVIFQNSYAATARIVTVVNQLFQDILDMV